MFLFDISVSFYTPKILKNLFLSINFKYNKNRKLKG